MTVIKVKIQQNFTVIYTAVLENPNLSFKAKGIWAYCMSRPNDWQFHVQHLATVSKDGVDAVYSALKELQKEGLVEKVQKNEGGKFGSVDYVIYPFPQEIQKILPLRDFPETENPQTENPALLRIDKIPRKEKHQTPPNPLKGREAIPPLLLEFGPFVKMKKEDHENLCSKHGAETIDGIIDEINDYHLSKGIKPYKDYAATIRNWLRKRKNTSYPTSGTTDDSKRQIEANKAFLNKLLGYLHTNNFSGRIQLRGQYVNHCETGDSIPLDLPTDTFEKILCKWAKVKHRNEGT